MTGKGKRHYDACEVSNSGIETLTDQKSGRLVRDGKKKKLQQEGMLERREEGARETCA